MKKSIVKLATVWVSDNPILKFGWIGFEVTDPINTCNAKAKLGDGITAWNDLPYSLSGGGLPSFESGIIATGSNQATASILTKEVNSVDDVSSGTGVINDALELAGTSRLVQNFGANDLLLYPFLGSNFRGQLANEPVTIAPGNQKEYFAYTNGVLTLI